ncbi:MAG: hypothetical protein HYY46_25470 [Deltaproteobacteria bacterium]|nr:hypothetical protein [Deltaproteobacteria bacterium]
MSQVLKGNFTPRKPVVVDELKEDLIAQFEREALKRLGGSIAFVAKKKFLYGTGKEHPSDDPSDSSRGK